MCTQINKANIITGKTLVFRDACLDDAEFILSLRTDVNKSRFLSQTTDDVRAQRAWLNSYKKSNTQAYFIIENMNGNKIGTVRLYDAKADSFCWGSWILSSDAPLTSAIESALMVYMYALEIGFNKTHFDVRKGNHSVTKFHERFGAHIVKENELDYFYEISHESILLSLSRYKRFLPKGIKIQY